MDLAATLTREAALAARRRDSAPGPKRYAVKAVWRTLQGEGAWAGRPAVFVRLAGCNLWTGEAEHRARDAERSGAECPRWCFAPDAPVVMADFSMRPIGEVAVGDLVLGAEPDERGRVRLVPTRVERALRREAPLARLHFDGLTVTGTADHPVLVRPAASRDRVRFVPAAEAVGRDTFSLYDAPAWPAPRSAEFWRGWLGGVAAGDGCFWTLQKTTRKRAVAYDRASDWTEEARPYRRFRLAMNDREALAEFERQARAQGFEGWHWEVHRGVGFKPYEMPALYLTRSATAGAFERHVLGGPESADYMRGFLGGLFDAEGHAHARGLHLAQSTAANPGVCERLDRYLTALGIPFTSSDGRWSVYGQASFRFLALCRPVLERKTRAFLGRSLDRSRGRLRAVEPLGTSGEVCTLTTGAGTYLMGGHVVRNCDTDFRKAGALKLSAADLADEVLAVAGPIRFVVLTGGEPLLQADAGLVAALRQSGFFVACETNGTVALADAFRHSSGDLVAPDWVACSPKLPEVRLRLEAMDELKLVVPAYRPEAYRQLAQRVRPHVLNGVETRYLWLQPEDGPRLQEATRLAVDVALAEPVWRVSVQTHKVLGVD